MTIGLKKFRNGVSTVVHKQISFSLFPAFLCFSNTTFCHWLSVNKIEVKIKRLFEQGTFTANNIILSRVVNLYNLTLAELVDKSRKEIVKTVIKRVKISSGFLVV